MEQSDLTPYDIDSDLTGSANEPTSGQSLKRKKRVVLSLLLLFFFLLGILLSYVDEDSQFVTNIEPILGLITSIFVFVWCRFDAAIRGYRFSSLLSVLLILVTPAALVYYLFKSRGFIKGSGAVLGAIGFFGVMFIATAAGVLVAIWGSDYLGGPSVIW